MLQLSHCFYYESLKLRSNREAVVGYTLVCPGAQSMSYGVLQLRCDLVKAAVSFRVICTERKASGISTEKKLTSQLSEKVFPLLVLVVYKMEVFVLIAKGNWSRQRSGLDTC